MVNIGGFFASLKLVSDKGSFDKGEGALKNIAKTAVSMGATIAKATLALTAMAGAMAMVERKSLLNAKSAGLSVDSYNQWSASANIMGISADGLTSSIGALDSKFQQLKLGQVDEGLAKSLAFLGLGFGQVANMKSEDRTKAVMSSALNMGDERKGAELVGQILGGAGKEFFYYLKMSGKSLNEVLEEAKKLTYTTYESKKNMMVFAHELSAVKGAFQSMGAYGLSKIAQQITPVITKMKEWLAVNKGLITSGIDKFANMIGNTFRTLAPVIAGAITLIKGVFNSMPEEAKAMVKVGLLIKQGPLGQLMLLFMLIEDVVRFTQGKTSLFGKFLQEFGKAFGVLDLNESMKKGWDDLFKGALATIQAIANIIKGFPDFLNGVSDAGSAVKSLIAGTSVNDIQNGLADKRNQRELAKWSPDFRAFTQGMHMPGGDRGKFKDEETALIDFMKNDEKQKKFRELFDQAGAGITADQSAQKWASQSTGRPGEYNLYGYPGYGVTGLDARSTEGRLLIEMTMGPGGNGNYLANAQAIANMPGSKIKVVQNAGVTK